MAVTQSAAAAFVGGGGALTATSRNGGFPSSKTQIACCSKPRSLSVPGHISVSPFSGASLESTPSRSFNIAADSIHVSAATKLEVAPVVEDEKVIQQLESPSSQLSPQASVSAFMADVANLIKLVDSRDIVELEVKHKEYEIVIKKETSQPALQATFPGPHVMAHTSLPGYPLQPPPSAPTPAPAALAPPPAPIATPAPPPAKPSHPPMLSPMAGTFYRSPGPGEPAFVQVGDKVTKGQVVCIIEAMKLMNEIEADQSGTIVEILAEDGKPISMESPLFSIKP